jgi:hypothetical protein
MVKCQLFGTPCLCNLHGRVSKNNSCLPMKMEQTGCSETLEYKIRDAGESPIRKHRTFWNTAKFEIKLILILRRSNAQIRRVWENISFMSDKLDGRDTFPTSTKICLFNSSFLFFAFFFFLSFNPLIGWQLSIWICRNPFFSLDSFVFHFIKHNAR